MKKIEGITVMVEGMTCSHCEASVKRNLEVLNGISEVVASNSSSTVKITGTDINLAKVKETVNGLGYRYVD
jgi:copper chaperone CopZ